MVAQGENRNQETPFQCNISCKIRNTRCLLGPDFSIPVEGFTDGLRNICHKCIGQLSFQASWNWNQICHRSHRSDWKTVLINIVCLVLIWQIRLLEYWNKYQVWSLTQLYSAHFLKTKILKESNFFSKSTKHSGYNDKKRYVFFWTYTSAWPCRFAAGKKYWRAN